MGLTIEARGIVRRHQVGGRWAGQTLTALDGIDLTVAPGDMLGVVGESGCGKTTLGRILVGLDRPTAGAVHIDGQPLDTGDGPAFRRMRRRVQYVFQDPLSALNPRLSIGYQIAEVVAVHGLSDDPRARARALLAEVGLGPGMEGRFVHQLSGGQRQRAVLARCLAVAPEAVIFDEAVSALDLSIQAQVIALIAGLRRARGLTGVFISHDLRVVRYVSDRIAVMYLGRIVEEGPADRVFHQPQHPYTQALIAAIPKPVPGAAPPPPALPAERPDPFAVTPGCAFHPRCPRARPRCALQRPALAPAAGGGQVACHAPLAPLNAATPQPNPQQAHTPQSHAPQPNPPHPPTPAGHRPGHGHHPAAARAGRPGTAR